ncbi:hypothetical protein ABEB36_013003 [Hypothenemus hampei]|uniref:Uncharacterized protein n=1 Tax=Hypothenemus hampei TaxID=57062 RepID=A0ABD1E6H2_HYPHA
MLVNPVNIVNLLLVIFQAVNFPNTPLTEKEREIAKEIERIILQACNDISSEFHTQDSLEFENPFEEHEPEIIEEIQENLDDGDFSSESDCIEDQEEVNLD